MLVYEFMAKVKIPAPLTYYCSMCCLFHVLKTNKC